ncbi:MAG TPA: hypothetical protein VHB79_34590 [Polyangiaceae bacterium]|nr:hypothetical protein [Polyangiaceae bacterium]
MKTISLRTVALAAPLIGALALAYGCAPEDTTTTATGGSGGTSSTTAGTSSTAGTTSTGGSTSTAGTSSTAGTGTTAGSGTGGSSGGTGTAGGSGGSGGTGTAGGSGGSGGGSADPCATDSKSEDCLKTVAGTMSSYGNPGWRDSWWVTGCAQKSANDCITNANTCNAKDGQGSEEKGARTTEKFPIGGVPGQHYKVTFKFNAVTEAKVYNNGHRDKAVVENDPHNTPLDMFYRDGESPITHYNVVKLTVFDDKGAEARHYYMNSAPELNGWEDHFTFLASYQKSIVIVGGGHIEHLVQDNNCHAIDNCGAAHVDGDSCPSPRKLPGGDDGLKIPSKYQDPIDGMVKDTSQLVAGYPAEQNLMQPWHAQAGHLTIISIEPTTDDVKKDYF